MKKAVLLIALAIGVVALILVVSSRHRESSPSTNVPHLTVAIAPYQDLAMLVNAPKLGLDAKAGVSLELITMAWEDILPAVASAGRTVDVGFGSYVEYLTKFAALNEGTADPVLYVQPLYVYKGGGFIALNPDIKPITQSELTNQTTMTRLRGYKIGAQKQSLYDMMIYSVARGAGIDPAQLTVIDTPMNDGLLALESKSLDLAAAGLTQVTEARKRGGEMVISMEDTGFADITGFICRKSTLDSKRPLIEALIRVWFQCVDYVKEDMQEHSANSLEYLRKNAATQYTYEEYIQALSQEFLPRSIDELRSNILTPGSKYDYERIGKSINDYLTSNKIIAEPSMIPKPLLGRHN